MVSITCKGIKVTLDDETTKVMNFQKIQLCGAGESTVRESSEDGIVTFSDAKNIQRQQITAGRRGILSRYGNFTLQTIE